MWQLAAISCFFLMGSAMNAIPHPPLAPVSGELTLSGRETEFAECRTAVLDVFGASNLGTMTFSYHPEWGYIIRVPVSASSSTFVCWRKPGETASFVLEPLE